MSADIALTKEDLEPRDSGYKLLRKGQHEKSPRWQSDDYFIYGEDLKLEVLQDEAFRYSGFDSIVKPGKYNVYILPACMDPVVVDCIRTCRGSGSAHPGHSLP